LPDEELATAASSQPHILQEDGLKATALSAWNHHTVAFNEANNKLRTFIDKFVETVCVFLCLCNVFTELQFLLNSHSAIVCLPRDTRACVIHSIFIFWPLKVFAATLAGKKRRQSTAYFLRVLHLIPGERVHYRCCLRCSYYVTCTSFPISRLSSLTSPIRDVTDPWPHNPPAVVVKSRWPSVAILHTVGGLQL
jgi:hypothetical protein